MPLKFTPNLILKAKFSGVEKGYDPLEVDEFLDQIIEDYQQFTPILNNREEQEATIAKQKAEIEKSKKDLLDAQSKIKKMGEEQLDLEAELSFQKSRIEKALKKYHELGEVDTLIGYLNYIAALETELTAMGGDVRKCKANCNRKAIQITKKSK